MIDKVYELVDATDDEMYFPIGIFSSVAAAEARMADDPTEYTDQEHDEYIKFELREHKLDAVGYGKPVRAWEWLSQYDESRDEYFWKPLPSSGEEAA